MSARRTWVLLASGASVVLAAGCNAILGNEEGTLAVAGDSGVDAGEALDAFADVVHGRDAGDVECPAGKKVCSGACVDIIDPNYGCGGTSCLSCGSDHATQVACAGTDAGIACKVTCADGFADCDGKPENGCESDLSAPEHCVEPTGHVVSTQCGSQCVDTTKDPTHCGSCTKACAAPANASATCTASVCGFECNTLYHRCNDACFGNSDATHCGTACTDCTTTAPHNTVPSCQSGACSYVCLKGFADCNGDLAKGSLGDGCEVDLLTDNANCGACNTACISTACLSCFTGGGTYCCNGTCTSSTQPCPL